MALYFLAVELYQLAMLGKSGCLCRASSRSKIAVAKKQEVSSKKTKTAPRAKSRPSKVDNAQVAGGNMTEDNKHTASAEAPRQQGMSPEMIGATAGDIWRVLTDRGGQTLTGLKRSIDASDDQVMLAVGWLAREDKLAFETNGRTITVSLR
jgi:hypothetical protein